MVTAGLLIIVAGILQIVARDFVWRWTEWSNQFRGLRTERTEQWEFASIMQGVGWIILGLVVTFGFTALIGHRNGPPTPTPYKRVTHPPGYYDTPQPPER